MSNKLRIILVCLVSIIITSWSALVPAQAAPRQVKKEAPAKVNKPNKGVYKTTAAKSKSAVQNKQVKKSAAATKKNATVQKNTKIANSKTNKKAPQIAQGKTKKDIAKNTKRVADKKNVRVVAKKPSSSTRRVSSWQETQGLVVQSNSAIVIDQRGGNALYQKNARTVVPIASITKLMTAMVVLDASPKMSQAITITDDDVDYLRGSRSRLPVGAMMTRETALLLALMSSENRAAHSLSRHYPGGMDAFVKAMNAKAKSLGMNQTRFEDPTGLTSANVSTAQDLARLVSAAYNYPLIREFSTTPEAVVDISGHEMVYHNTNPLVKSASWDVGLSKTGFIHEAGKCLVMQARVANRPVVIVLLDANGRLTRVGDANRIKKWMENASFELGDKEAAL